MYDLIVVGAGPAGAVLAAAVGKRFRTLILEKRRLDQPYTPPMTEKCCGGLLAPDAQKALEKIGCALDPSVLCLPQTFQVHCLDLNSGLRRTYRRNYINMDREKFDRFLFRRISQGDIRTGCTVKDVRKVDGGFEIEWTQEHQRQTAQGRLLVCADGAGSVLRRKIDPSSEKTPVYAAIQQIIEPEGEKMPLYGSYFDNTLTDFYAWTIPKDGKILFGAALPKGKDAPAAFETLKSRLIAQGVPIGGRVVRTQGAKIRRPNRLSQLVPVKNGAAFLGECGGFISSSSAEGLSYAITTGTLLADALLKYPDDLPRALKAYRRACLPLKLKCGVRMIKGRVLYHPLTRKIAMKSGLTAVKDAEQP